MDKSKRDLEAVVNAQKEQLARYEKRLKDVVTAYKGLLKEKEALENSFAAIAQKKEEPVVEGENNEEDGGVQSRRVSVSQSEGAVVSESGHTGDANLQAQIATLMNSLATLSAEKSRMEASFQADKKQLRSQLQQKEQTINDLENQIKEVKRTAKTELEEMKAKWIVERQEREQETNNQMLMIRELQKLYADERHLKENIEMQLNNFKTHFANSEVEHVRINELQAQLKESRAQLKQMLSEKGQTEAAAHSKEDSTFLKQLQKEMKELKEQHAIAIKNEQRRVQLAEEQSRHQVVLHEDRVANLEARLAELSRTVGSYDRLRQQDQDSIQLLKKQLQDLEKNAADKSANSPRPSTYETCAKIDDSANSLDVSDIVDEIVRLKKILLVKNRGLKNPMDLSNIFAVASDHTQCQENMNRAAQRLELSQNEVAHLNGKVAQQKEQIATLQDKVAVLNRNIEEQEVELKNFNEKLQLMLFDERNKWKSQQNETETEFRCKINDLEQQLHKQRQRSLQLLEDKDQEIRALHTSFEIFHSTADPNPSHAPSALPNTLPKSDAPSYDEGKADVKAKKMSIGENCHMLHYANEIARKDIEIANLRKAKYQAETAMRKAIHDKVTAQEELNEKVATLEEHVDRLERCKTRESANLEYLKNVVISYMVSRDIDDKRHMMKAISEVLQFNPSELQSINAALLKK